MYIRRCSFFYLVGVGGIRFVIVRIFPVASIYVCSSFFLKMFWVEIVGFRFLFHLYKCVVVCKNGQFISLELSDREG